MSEGLKTGLFDYINNISVGKTRLADEDEAFQSNYNPFMVGRGLSLYIDCVFWANALNEYHGDITKKMHYDFLFHALKKTKRYSKWHKESKQDQVEAVAEYYMINHTRAEEILSFMSNEELDHILRSKGGKLK